MHDGANPAAHEDGGSVIPDVTQLSFESLLDAEDSSLSDASRRLLATLDQDDGNDGSR
jgi:hypothetical protein